MSKPTTRTELSAASASPSSSAVSETEAEASSSPAARSHQHLALVDSTNEPMRNYDGTEMRDANSCIVYKSQFLSTHPLRSDCKERVGYAGMKLTYVSGDGVIR